ncbi:hypothetical protein POTOM_043249 [Populus tomentosa]|uniref:EF-hand domain-containing protein n=1 Tax=Populus tomentosa TaxID=118781 RepID=A0A8X8CGI1_POPTO|nr:hypothetical protein POTOM_043249 [Populus tomentosa]
MKSRVGKILVRDSGIRFSFSSSILEFTSLSIYTFLFSFVRVACVYCLCIPQASSSGDGNGHSEDLVSPSELGCRLGLIGGELILREAKLAEESLDSDGDGLLALEDLVGLMEGSGRRRREVA